MIALIRAAAWPGILRSRGNKNPSTGGFGRRQGFREIPHVHPASDHKNTMDGNFEENMMTERFLDGFLKDVSNCGL
jgi:hypothetical protein